MPVLPFPFDDEDDDHSGMGPWPTASVEVTETDNPVIGQLYGPDGEVLFELRERRTVPFGYRRDA